MPSVALITHQFPSPEHPYIVDWARGLVQAGVDLAIFSEQPGQRPALTGGLREAQFWAKVKDLNSLDHPWGSLRRSFFSGAKNMFRISRAARLLATAYPGRPLSVLRRLYEYLPLLGERFAIVHFNAPQVAVRRFELGRLLGGKTLVSFRGQDFSFDAPRFTPLLRQADHLHFISNHLITLARAQGYAGLKHTLIPPMVDLAFYCPAGQAPALRPQAGPWNLFSAGRFTWVKGWEFALQAVALLVERGWDIHYTIAGEGELREMVLYTCHQLGIAGRVHLPGWLSPAQVRDGIQRADLYLLASVDEAFNNSVLQAQACGLPAVCSDAGGLPENIQDGVTGLLFRRRDARDVADKIEHLLSDPALRLRMGCAARRRAEAHFSLPSGVAAFAAMYQNLAV